MGKHNDSKKLPDTPWHIGYAKKDVDDPRRHKSRCLYLNLSICECNQCETYLLKCPSSSHCKYYAETLYQDELNKNQHMSIEKENENRANEYRQRFQNQRKNMLAADQQMFSYLKFRNMISCPICNEKLPKTDKVKHCGYCGASYIRASFLDDIPISNQSFFIIGKKNMIPKKIEKKGKSIVIGSGSCVWLKKKCSNPSSPYYNYRCQRCEFFKSIRLK